MRPSSTPARSKRSRSAQSTPRSAKAKRPRTNAPKDVAEKDEEEMDIEDESPEGLSTPRQSFALPARRSSTKSNAASTTIIEKSRINRRNIMGTEGGPSQSSSPSTSISHASTKASTRSKRSSLPDIDHMTQQAAHKFFEHDANEKPWQHVELHKDLEALYENAELTPIDKVYTHDLRNIEVQYRYPDNRSPSRSRSASAVRSPAREVDAQRVRIDGTASSNINSKQRSVRRRTPVRGPSQSPRHIPRGIEGIDYASDMGFVERDVIRAHLGDEPEPGSSIAADVRRWNSDDEDDVNDNNNDNDNDIGNFVEEESHSKDAMSRNSRSKSPKAVKANKAQVSDGPRDDETGTAGGSQRKLRYPFSLISALWAGLMPSLWAIYEALHWVLLTLPTNTIDGAQKWTDTITSTGYKSYDVIVDAFRKVQTAMSLQSKALQDLMYTGTEALDSLPRERKRHFYASFFTGIVIFLFAVEGLLGRLSSFSAVTFPFTGKALTQLWFGPDTALPSTMITEPLSTPAQRVSPSPDISVSISDSKRETTPVPVTRSDFFHGRESEGENGSGVADGVPRALTSLLSALYSTYDRLTSAPASSQVLRLSDELVLLRKDVEAFQIASQEWSVLKALPFSQAGESSAVLVVDTTSDILVGRVKEQHGKVQALMRSLRSRLVNLALAISAPGSDAAARLSTDLDAHDNGNELPLLKAAIRSLKAYMHQNKSLMRDLEELEQQWADLINKHRWRASQDGDLNAATNPEAWDPLVIKDSASGMLTEFGDNLRVLMSFKKDVPAPKNASEGAASVQASEEDGGSRTGSGSSDSQVGDDDGSKGSDGGDDVELGRSIMKPTGFYDGNGHWWRIFNDGYDPAIGPALTTEQVSDLAREEANSLLEEYLRESSAGSQAEMGRAAKELLQMAELAAVSAAPTESVVQAWRDNALGISGTPSKSLLRDAPHASREIGGSIRNEDNSGLLGVVESMQEEVDETDTFEATEASPYLSLLHHRQHHPGPQLVDYASPSRGAMFLPYRSSHSHKKIPSTSTATGVATDIELCSPSFLHAFVNPFTSPVLTAKLDLKHSMSLLHSVLLDAPGVRSVVDSLSQMSSNILGYPVPSLAPAPAPTAVQANVKFRENRFGFKSIVSQMMTLLSPWEAYADNVLLSRWAPYLEAPIWNKVVALIVAVQRILRLQGSSIGAEAGVLGWDSTAVEVPVGFSLRGSEGSVTVVFPNQKLLRKVAVQFALQIPASYQSGSGSATAHVERGESSRGNSELSYTCAAPTRIRLLGWLHEPQDSHNSQQVPLELGDMVIPASALLVPSSLRGNISDICSIEEIEGYGSVVHETIALSPTSNVLMERTLRSNPDPSSPSMCHYAYYGTFVSDIPQFLRDTSGHKGDRITRPTLRAVTATVMSNSNGEAGVQERDDCTTLYRLRMLGTPHA